MRLSPNTGASSAEATVLLLASALLSSSSNAFQSPAAHRGRYASKTALGAVGLGPDQTSDAEEGTVVVAEAPEGYSSVITGEDGEFLKLVTDHDPNRLKRMSDSDTRADDWFGKLLGEDGVDGSFLGSVSAEARSRLLTPVELKDDPVLTYGDEDWTPYVTKRLPTSNLYPAYGLENFGLPTPRRGAEAWKQFDVAGLIDTDYSTSPDGVGTDNVDITSEEADDIVATLQAKGAWLDDDACRGRLVYVDGRFCPSLSKQTDEAKNLQSSDFAEDSSSVDDRIRTMLSRLPDGHTDELAAVVPEVNNQGDEESLTSLKKLSAPDHSVGDCTSQFAINNQQGTAAFAALNLAKAGCVAFVESPAMEEGEESTEKPVLVIHAQTPSGGKKGEEGKGVAVHPRTLAIAGDGSVLSLVQMSVDIDGDEARPTLTNGYTQVYVGAKANFTHSFIDETGGFATPNVEITDMEMSEAKLAFRPGTEDSDEPTPFPQNPREIEAARPALRDTLFQVIDAHVTGDDGSYTGSIMELGGCGRSRICVSTSLLRPGAFASLNGFALSGGTQRSDMRTNIHHIAQGTKSRQEQRNMVGGRSTSSFRGRIRVEQSAQQTDSEQLSRTILLSDHARIWATPSLEIIADDVVCTHGATVSDLSEEELFYLRTRGIDISTARNMLMYAFVEEIGQSVDPAIAGEYNDENGLRSRVVKRLQNLVPRGEKMLVGGEFQSV